LLATKAEIGASFSFPLTPAEVGWLKDTGRSA
jgi:hypothetical protein